MMTVIATTGRDVVLRKMNDGTSVINLALAYNIGYGDKRKTQWIETSIFGKRAESLAQHLPKGTKVQLTVNEVQIDEYVKGDGTSTPKLVGRFIDIQLIGGKPADQKQPSQKQQQSNSFDDFNEEPIPF